MKYALAWQGENIFPHSSLGECKLPPINVLVSLVHFFFFFFGVNRKILTFSWSMAGAEGVMGRVRCGRNVNEWFLFHINYYRNTHHRYIISISIYVGCFCVHSNITNQMLGWFGAKNLSSEISLRFGFQLWHWVNVWMNETLSCIFPSRTVGIICLPYRFWGTRKIR